MSRQALNKVREEALELPESERAELAHDLVSSLDGPSEDGVSLAWETEIARRLDEVEGGMAKLVDRAEFDRRLKDRLRRL